MAACIAFKVEEARIRETRSEALNSILFSVVCIVVR
jgi:hypothetical protein